MLMKNEMFIEAMEFIVESVAQSTGNGSKAEIGIYLAGLVVADQNKQLSPSTLEGLKLLIEQADEVALEPS